VQWPGLCRAAAPFHPTDKDLSVGTPATVIKWWRSSIEKSSGSIDMDATFLSNQPRIVAQ
jgi:uncharacterized protein YfaP (DUF2135 family)